MKVAFLTDVHGNLPALEAVLAHAQAQGVDQVWNGGDYVGYGPFPEQCVQLLREIEDAAVVGNYDRKVLRVPRKMEKWRRTKHPLKALAFQWAHDHLSEASLDYLARLPRQVRRWVAGVSTLLTHASLDSIKEVLGPSTSPERWRKLEDLSQADVVLSGHCHRPFMRAGSRTQFVNPGSVGRPEDGDPRAAYGLVEFSGGACQVQLQRVSYDVERTVAEIHRLGLPDAFAAVFRRARKLAVDPA
jgi:predicted phosphodiesterase